MATAESSFRGTARINLESLEFNSLRRVLDVSNVKRLVGVFQELGCDSLDPQNRIPGLLSQQDLDEALVSSGESATALFQKPFPMLKLPPNKRAPFLSLLCYWALNTRIGITKELEDSFRAEYINSHDRCNGEKYLQIRHY
ncbi:uncharacterized protein BDZ99DRAFT_482785 [Mytilinidion resinicola]|uniref:Uncharacterized protein n=1 Tax=Mytilinidion resinicola TaxID=574789 RepID=A0A6A6Y1X7_9PEZI|nr:uncharacterized protein BDZ99DRAFT_482785 [Mytilinidion resinicola]KAF2802660.1 hypothetical protein BDZ99DRAFT_482785 [Mytilinidion resinicola]